MLKYYTLALSAPNFLLVLRYLQMNKSFRVFLAIDIPKEAVQKLKKFRDPSLPVRWTKPENLHVTLNFLGDIDEEQLAQAFEIAKNVCGGTRQNIAKLVMVIPQRYMIWAVIERNPGLEKLYINLNDQFHLAGIGQEYTKSFRPHACLARGKSNLEKIAHSYPCDISFPITRVVIFKSVLKEDGPRYESLDSFELTGNNLNA